MHLHQHEWTWTLGAAWTAYPTWGDIFECGFESSKLNAQRFLLPRFCEKRRSSFELWKIFRKCHPKWDWTHVMRSLTTEKILTKKQRKASPRTLIKPTRQPSLHPNKHPIHTTQHPIHTTHNTHAWNYYWNMHTCLQLPVKCLQSKSKINAAHLDTAPAHLTLHLKSVSTIHLSWEGCALDKTDMTTQTCLVRRSSVRWVVQDECVLYTEIRQSRHVLWGADLSSVCYGVATVSRIDYIIGLCYRISSLL